MPSALDKVIESFTNPTIQPIVVQPTYKTLAAVHLKFNTNAASFQLHLGNGKLGLLFLTISPPYKIPSPTLSSFLLQILSHIPSFLKT